MQAIADHAYHILIIAFVATTIVQAVIKVVRTPRKKKRGPVAPRESAVDREKRMRERYAAFGDRWREWLDQPRGRGDTDRLVTAASIWGSPEQGASFPRRFHDSQLGKVMVDKRSYLAMLDAPADAVQPRRELAPSSWATMRLDVWALHSKAAQKPRLMRVWLSRDRALVELHRTRVVKVDEILPSEVVGFVRGFTRLGPRTGKVDGLRWLPAETMELGAKPLWNTFRAMRDISCVTPEGSTVADALNAADFHAFAFVAFRSESAWKEPYAHLRVLDCSGVTYQVGDAFSLQLDEGQEERASRRGRGRPSRRRSLRRRRSSAEETVVSGCDEQQVAEPEFSELPEREPEPLADTDLAVVPIDPREVLWAVEKMVEL
ncbi:MULTISPECIES: hypothetical protein [Actinomycetes]|jgi:hypothetical protein|uniref:hypothetical protein n=1 Tax=Actinomycetes TaxID=1760 RepID=UPI000660871D|nr:MULTISPECIES: hypothetical protein [Actinomycetes]MCQ5273040.1 hypothetical protein [Schaalia odontolytica]MCQ5282384.1 hypothetical protein [Schaalia odontolytica]